MLTDNGEQEIYMGDKRVLNDVIGIVTYLTHLTSGFHTDRDLSSIMQQSIALHLYRNYAEVYTNLSLFIAARLGFMQSTYKEMSENFSIIGFVRLCHPL